LIPQSGFYAGAASPLHFRVQTLPIKASDNPQAANAAPQSLTSSIAEKALEGLMLFENLIAN
jgi:hypothetical protein